MDKQYWPWFKKEVLGIVNQATAQLLSQLHLTIEELDARIIALESNLKSDMGFHGTLHAALKHTVASKECLQDYGSGRGSLSSHSVTKLPSERL